jgi:hypothetical protein
MTQIETEFTPSAYPVPGRLVKKDGILGNGEIPDLESEDVTSVFMLGLYLKSVDPVYYSDERLHSMTKNDMRYAHRVHEGIDDVDVDTGGG